MWQFKNNIPIYQQIIAAIRTGILNGTYPPGSKMPPVRELALQAGVNPNTMQRALSELERDGLLHAERTSGRFVTEDQVVLRTLSQHQADACIQSLFEQLQEMGYTKAGSLERIREWAESHEMKGE